MPRIVFLPHPEICPEGAVVDAQKGESLCEAALRNGIDIEHACEMSCACTTCLVHIRDGYADLPEAD
jgi:2Fe-2S ferredoxin